MSRVREEDGFMLLELMIATVVLSIALLALMAGYDSAFVSVHKASQKSVATALANQQLELYAALPVDQIGLDQTTVTNVGTVGNAAYDSLYATNALLVGGSYTDATGTHQYPDGTANEVQIPSCGTGANCLPIQTVIGSDGHTYRVETFVRKLQENTSGISWWMRDVWVIVRDPSDTSDPELVELQTAFNDPTSS